jgi:hypothetical protein
MKYEDLPESEKEKLVWKNITKKKLENVTENDIVPEMIVRETEKAIAFEVVEMFYKNDATIGTYKKLLWVPKSILVTIDGKKIIPNWFFK